jgi:hypothetical protein
MRVSVLIIYVFYAQLHTFTSRLEDFRFDAVAETSEEEDPYALCLCPTGGL